MSDPKIESVQRMYEAFGRADVDAILAEVADDVDWVAGTSAAETPLPWYGSYRGKAELPRFFKEIGTNVEVTEFVPLSFTSNETDVMVAVRWAYTVGATGKHADAVHMLHWFRFDRGEIVAVRTLEDTAQAAPAFT